MLKLITVFGISLTIPYWEVCPTDRGFLSIHFCGISLNSKSKFQVLNLKLHRRRNHITIMMTRNTEYSNFCRQLETVQQKHGCKIAITYMKNDGSDEKYTFQEIAFLSRQAGKEFVLMNLKAGDRAAVVMPHSPWAVLIGFALAEAGITGVLIDASLPSDEISNLIEFSEVKTVFTCENIYRKFDTKISEQIPCFHVGKGLVFTQLNSICRAAIQPGEPGDREVIAILYSSGTTGEMKGVMVTYQSVLKAREVFIRLSGLKEDMSYLLVLPFNHIAGFTGAMTYLLTGCELGFIEDVNAVKLKEGLLKFQPSFFAMVPKVFEVMESRIREEVKAKGFIAEKIFVTALKTSQKIRRIFGINIGKKIFHNITAQIFGENIFGIGTGASPCKAETAEFFLGLGLEWANLYATTETSVPITATGVLDQYPANTVGNVTRHPEIEIKIADPDNQGIGEILVKSELMMKGYFKRPDLTDKAYQQGFFRTGDCGYIDNEMNLHLTGRIKESVILKNGKKVSPSDVDQYYQAKVSRYDMASRGVVNPGAGYDELHMFVASGNIDRAVQEKVKAALKNVSENAPDMYKLAGIHFIPSIPRTNVGKVKRFCLEYRKDAEPENKPDNVDLIPFLNNLTNRQDICAQTNIHTGLGLDSLSKYELISAIEDHFHCNISALLPTIQTVEDLERTVHGGAASDREVPLPVSSYPLPRGEKEDRRYRMFMRMSGKIWDIRVYGLEHINSDSQYIFCPNHESYLDGLWIAGLLPSAVRTQICSMAADKLFLHRIHRAGVRLLGGIPVQRMGNPLPALKRCRECILDGSSLLVHPEGTRSRSGMLGEFKNGAAQLSIDTGVPIVPVYIGGAFEIYPPRRKLPHLFDWKHFKRLPLCICFGEQIQPEGTTAQELMDLVRKEIVNMRDTAL